MIAKIASDFRKPFGVTVIQPHEVKEFVGPLPLRKIPGIGPASEERLAKLKLKLCSDVWPYSLADLSTMLGENMAGWIYWRSRGIDHRKVQNSRERKSLSMERTFSKDILDRAEIEQIMDLQIDELIQSLLKKTLGENLES